MHENGGMHGKITADEKKQMKVKQKESKTQRGMGRT